MYDHTDIKITNRRMHEKGIRLFNVIRLDFREII